MKQLPVLVIFGLLALASCKDELYPGFEQTEDGLWYKIHTDVDTGATPAKGEYLTLDIVYKTKNDSVFMSSYDQNQPLVFPFPGEEHPGDIYSGIGLMKVGDSATFILNADSFFVQTARQEMPPFLNPGDVIKVDVVLNEILSAEQVQQKQMEMMQEEQEMSMARAEEEKSLIADYMATNNLKGDVRPSGLVFIQTRKGTGQQAEAGKTVKVNYVGKLMDGTVFDTSIKEAADEAGISQPQRTYEPFTLPLGQGRVIPGWEEGLTLMREGEKATLIIPSSMAYGAQGYGPIPPNSILIFDVEMIDVE